MKEAAIYNSIDDTQVIIMGVFILRFLDFFGTDNKLAGFVNFPDSINPTIVAGGLLSVCAIFILVSYLISVKVLENKEF